MRYKEIKISEYGVGIVTKQNATKDVPVGGEYMNVKKLGLDKKPKKKTKSKPKNEAHHLKNPKNTFLTKADTAYDFIRVGKTISNLKDAPKDANRDEPDVMVVPYGGKKEKDHLKKGLNRVGYKTQDADKDGDDAHVDEAVKKCKDGEYYCNTDQKCKPIPKGYHVMPDGELMKDGEPHESLREALGEIKKNSEIYVDMDGVLADFFGEWSKSQGVDNWKDIKDPAQAIGDIKDIDDFWLNLPLLPKAKELLGLIKQVKGSYSICTSPLADDPRSEPHKREWIKNNLSFFPPKNVFITHNKPQFAKQKDGTPNILIDDYGVNIGAWEEAGGIGFKYKDYKFNRTAKAIKNKIEEPATENFADGEPHTENSPVSMSKDTAVALGKMSKDTSKAIDKYQQTNTTGKTSRAFTDIEDEYLDIRKLAMKLIKNGLDPYVAYYKASEKMQFDPAMVFDWMGSEYKDEELEDFIPVEYERDWIKRAELGMTENFADGKKKGKSRPGRVKKSGASCKGSVTDLRKRAKGASGEKRKMYHWCANMKSGRSKK